MKERPIIFSAPMVRAILDGTKTQTRRIVNGIDPDMPSGHFFKEYDQGFVALEYIDGHYHPWDGVAFRCPYGKPGDRLWVRETFHTSLIGDAGTAIDYKAGPETTNEQPYSNFTTSIEAYEWTAQKYKKHWMPSIHMPRWASRILLEVTDVRVERVQAISEADAIDEGIDTMIDQHQTKYCRWHHAHYSDEGVCIDPGECDCCGYSYVQHYTALWDSTNAKRGYGWEANPWVWVVEFKRIEP